jgi:hypothetical protein
MLLSIVFLSTPAVCHRDYNSQDIPVTPAVLRDTVKEILYIYKLKEDERSACFGSPVVGRSNAVFILILFLRLDENSLAEL